MFINIENMIRYTFETENYIESPNYTGQKIAVKSFLITFRHYIRVLQKIKCFESDKNIAEVAFNLDYYPKIISLVNEGIIKTKLKRMYNIDRLSMIRTAMITDTFTLQLDYTKGVDMRIGLILIYFFYLMITYQIVNRTLKYCNRFALERMIDAIAKFLLTPQVFPLNISSKLIKSFTHSIEFKMLLLQTRMLDLGSD